MGSMETQAAPRREFLSAKIGGQFTDWQIIRRRGGYPIHLQTRHGFWNDCTNAGCVGVIARLSNMVCEATLDVSRS